MQLADTPAANGHLAEAIATLEEAVSDRAALRANAQLASLYRRNGQDDKARR
jgi:Tfp pilus assembly protein PilF